MEKTYFLVKTGEQIPAGKDIQKVEKINTPFGRGTRVTTIPMNETTIPALIKAGIIREGVYTASGILNQIETHDMDYYLNKIANRMGWKAEKVCNYLNNLMEVNPSSALSIVLKTIAVDLDKKYPDYIGNSPRIFTISMLNGKITEVNKATIKNYRNFAAFRTIEDARYACHVCREQLKELFND